jgi:hypothetical protein
MGCGGRGVAAAGAPRRQVCLMVLLLQQPLPRVWARPPVSAAETVLVQAWGCAAAPVDSLVTRTS